MRASLQVRLSQHLALTPQLQQSIRLLQLSTLELQQEVGLMLEANPFLEMDEEQAGWDLPLERALEGAGAGSETAASRSETERLDQESLGTETAPEESAAELTADDFGHTAQDDWANGTEADDFDGIAERPGTTADADESPEFGARAAHLSLQDHLKSQVPGLRLPAHDAAAVVWLIDSLDDDGYLTDPLEDIAQNLLGDQAQDADLLEDVCSQLRCARHWLQRLDPPGVGAAHLADCLQLQLRREPLAQAPAQALALTLCAEHLDTLARRDLKRLASLTHSSLDEVREAMALIGRCEPKPGRPFAEVESLIVVPDVIVARVNRAWKVRINPEVMPKLRIHALYAAAVKSQRGSELSGRLQEARWFLKNIQQRFDTILRVSEAIVERQKAFFTHGELAMKPLVLREIADELGLHESTISRVTTAKYMATPLGTFELKYFFGSSLGTETGGNTSSTAVRALLKQFIAAENPKKPLSDAALSDMLEEQGIQVARRTVAKYREGLKIPTASLRRAL